MDYRNITFIINPISGTSKDKHFENLIYQIFPKSEFKTTILFTERKGHASELALKLSNEKQLVIAVGGDGTLNEVGCSLLNSKTAAMGIVPMGSGNGLARSLEIPLHLEKALQRIKDGSKTYIDTCSFNDIPFFCTAGVAFDALVAKDFDQLPLRGLKTYFQASFRQFVKYKGTQISYTINGESTTTNTFMMAIANANQYGYGAKISPLSSVTDGLLEVVIIDKMTMPEFAEFTIRLFSGTIQKFKHSKTLKTQNEILLDTDSRLAHLDGEPIEFDGRASIKILPKSLPIIL